jgi:hypothetical protein
MAVATSTTIPVSKKFDKYIIASIIHAVVSIIQLLFLEAPNK